MTYISNLITISGGMNKIDPQGLIFECLVTRWWHYWKGWEGLGGVMLLDGVSLRVTCQAQWLFISAWDQDVALNHFSITMPVMPSHRYDDGLTSETVTKHPTKCFLSWVVLVMHTSIHSNIHRVVTKSLSLSIFVAVLEYLRLSNYNEEKIIFSKLWKL